MSRIGMQPINLPSGVVVSAIDGGIIEVRGPRGLLQQQVAPTITVEVSDRFIKVVPVDPKKYRAFYGLYRALIYNMVVGVSIGFKRTLELVGVGYKASIQDKLLELSLGYSHDIVLVLPEEVTARTELPKGKSPLVHLESMDKQLLGQVAAKIRSLRKVEPYKGKGVRFLGELVRRKVGKSTKK